MNEWIGWGARNRTAAVTNTSDELLPFGFHNDLAKMHSEKVPFWGKTRWKKRC